MSGRSPYLPAAIVRVRNLFGAGTDSHKQSAVALTAFGEFLPSGTPRNFCVNLIRFNKLSGLVRFELPPVP